MNGFSWIIEGEIGGMPRPGLAQDELWRWLSSQGVRLVVSLTEAPPDKDLMAKYNIESLHLPVPDFTAPRQDDLKRFIEHVKFHRHEKHAIAVHCGAGIGRTGTFLAAYLVWRGMNADEAITLVRDKRPGSVETDEQERAVREFAASLAQGPAKAASNPGKRRK